MAAGRFDWQDGERTIHFGRGRAAQAVELIGGPGFTLLTTERAAAAAPDVAEAATDVHYVAAGRVDELAAGLLGEVSGQRLAALGGGRVIDVAKAIAAARGGGTRVLAIPTTLSGAEMTRGHRHAAGVDPATPRVRPAVVVFDAALAASQPVPDLAASALNALGHAVEGPCTPRANPVGSMAADEAARLIALAFAPPAGEPDRDALALGAMLAGYAIDSAGYGLHHVISQTVVRAAGIGHGPANAVLLPHSIGALAWRFPERHERLTAAMGGDPVEVAGAICRRTGATRLQELGVSRDVLPRCAEQAAARDDLEQTPPRADRAEILALYEHAY